jgi:hypothetical protein
MSKRIARGVAFASLGALLIGIAGCGQSSPPPVAKNTDGTPQVPQSVLNQMKNMPPAAQQRIQAQMQNTPQGAQVQQALQPGAQQGGSPQPGAPSGGQ